MDEYGNMEEEMPDADAALPALKTSLLSLPDELLSCIARSVSPCGGHSISSLSLTSRRLSSISTPLLWESLVLPQTDLTRDALFAAILSDPDRRRYITSFKILLPTTPIPFASWAILLSSLPGLRRVEVRGETGTETIPIVLRRAMSTFPALREVRFVGMDLHEAWDISSWVPKLEILGIERCVRAGWLFSREEARREDPEVGSTVTTLVVDPATPSAGAHSPVFMLAFVAFVDTLREVTFVANELSDMLFQQQHFLAIDFTSIPLKSFTLTGTSHVFSAEPSSAPTQAALVHILRHFSLSSLDSLTLPVTYPFVVPTTLYPISMPRLKTLCLRAEPPKSNPRSFLTSTAAGFLIILLVPTRFPSLHTLHLKGWFDSLPVSRIALTPTSNSTPVFSPLGLFALLYFLLDTTVLKVVLSNSEGAGDGRECWYWREEGGKAWEKRLVSYL